MATFKPRIRLMKIESHTYSIENPNPEWEIKGEKWIHFALHEWKPTDSYDVAYIPHIPILITKGKRVHTVIPTYWEEGSNATNFYMGGYNNEFRLNARYKPPGNLYVGSRQNIDFNPDREKDLILELLKLAEVIFEPGDKKYAEPINKMTVTNI